MKERGRGGEERKRRGGEGGRCESAVLPDLNSQHFYSNVKEIGRNAAALPDSSGRAEIRRRRGRY